ncbi:MAG: ADP-ribosylglycohydrolase family protein [Rhizobiales bacterium]|nr:ADP-ribosylglycohydrolase family protein [Hyphomicrobiales bacterium]OJY02960.1 MAG: ADP-ribosylglycohydrolase [Rhizobiales bacterium 63-22]
MKESAMLERAMGALLGGALGDALGMPTQLLSPAEIRATYGFVDRFIAPSSDHPVSQGLPAGSITDDTEQTLLLGRILLESGASFDHKRWVGALLEWERDVKARGSYDLLGPSTKRAIDAINRGVPPEEAGKGGDTNGAAMRIAPVGILMPPEPLDALVEKVAETCLTTHNSATAIAAAAAVAATVSHGVAGESWREACEYGAAAARRAANFGHDAADIGACIERARQLVRGKPQADAIDLIVNEVGTSVASRESVPAAFAVLEVAEGDPWLAAVIGANLGNDTDTIAAIAAGMAGACAGLSALPKERIAELKGIDLDAVRRFAGDLVSARLAAMGAAL